MRPTNKIKHCDSLKIKHIQVKVITALYCVRMPDEFIGTSDAPR